MTILSALAAPFTSAPPALPRSKKERDALKAATLRQAEQAKQAKLSRLEAEAVAAREEHRAAESATIAAHEAADRQSETELARDIFAAGGDSSNPTLCWALKCWRTGGQRKHVQIAINLLRGFSERAALETGESLTASVPAVAFARTLVNERPGLRAIFGQPDFFEGSWVDQRVLESSAAVFKARDVVTAEAALRALELVLHSKLEADADEPTSKEVATWEARVSSSTSSGYNQRLRALRQAAQDVHFTQSMQLGPTPSPATDTNDDSVSTEAQESDADFDAQTEALVSLGRKQDETLPVHDTEHFDRLASEQLAPRAVPPEQQRS